MKQNKKPSKFKQKLSLARNLAIQLNSPSFTVDGKKYIKQGNKYKLVQGRY